MRIYLAGPMTGYPNFNYDGFFAAEKEWAAAGFEVLNPARHFEGDQSRPYADYIRADIQELCDRAEAVAMLKGWESSRGAFVEWTLAKALGLPIWDARWPGAEKPVMPTILDEAREAVFGARAKTYGHPKVNFARNAAMWEPIFGTEVTAVQVAQAMAAVKLARLIESPMHRDSWVDLAGYAETGARVLGLDD
jgi:hypothetical protein